MSNELKNPIIIWSISTLLIWSISAVSIILNPKNRLNQCISAVAFFCGVGSFALALEYISKIFFSGNYNIYKDLFLLSDVLAGISLYFGPHSLLIFGIAFWEYYSINYFKHFRKVAFFTLIPILFMYILIPVHPTTSWHFILLSIWVGPYTLFTTYLLYKALLSPADYITRSKNFIIFIVVAISTNACFVMCYLSRVFPKNNLSRYFYIVIIIVSLIIVVAFVNFGFSGSRSKITRLRMESSNRSSSEGIQLLNHGIKNDLSKINLSVQIIKNVIVTAGLNLSLVKNELSVVDSSIIHIEQLLFRIRSQTGGFDILREQINVVYLVEQSIHENLLLLKAKKIIYSVNINKKASMYVDIFHFKEVINNIIKNSIEAANENDSIEFLLTRYSNRYALVIKDSGKGIPSDILPYLFEPFYTTKRSSNNYGLGLTYCYNVMKKHSGDIRITSKEGQGTKVFLIFSPSTIIDNELQDKGIGKSSETTCNVTF